jgi:hypothetical protein
MYMYTLDRDLLHTYTAMWAFREGELPFLALAPLLA